MSQKLPDWLCPGTTIVTASARLARRLSWQYTMSRLAAGEQVWETPDILPWTAWLNRLWSLHQWAGGRGETNISAAQRRLIWQQVLESSSHRKSLLQPATVADRAIDAWQMLQDWGLATFPDGIFLNEDARAFRSWASAYERRCAESRWLDESALPAELTRIVQQSPPLDRRPLLFAGFDEMVPAREHLIEALAKSGVTASRPARTAVSGRAMRVPLTDTRAELVAAACWARLCLERNPGATIGIVVPGLQAQRAAVQEIFSDMLVPAALLAAPESAQRVFSIATGQPLNTQTVIDHGLLVLAFATAPLGMADVAALLRSPYLRGAEAEAAQRALLDARLRHRREPELTLDTLLAEGERQPEPAMRPAALLDSLRTLRERARELSRRQRAAAWTRTFSDLLKSAGWPGDRAFTSVEYQTLSAWRELLGELASLDPIAGQMGFSTALGHLRRLAAERPFQPQTPEAPIQIIDMAGAADMAFDHLWVTGMHEEAWPRSAQPNPFIPLSLQREHGMPRSSAEVELARARRWTDSLLGSCQDVVVSWPEHEGDRSLRPSPLVLALEPGVPELPAPRTWVRTVYEARAEEHFNDDTGPALAVGTEVRGGAALFKDQAACPFRAFAHHRLLARSLDEVDVGLDAMARGILVHRVLQLFWQAAGTQQRLIAMSAQELDVLVDRSVGEVLGPVAARRPFTFTERFTVVERDRLRVLVREWLDLERGRPPFEVVACEQTRAFRVGGIDGQLRADRLDRLADGRLVVIDYKTGNVPSHPWDGDRPEEPQLPLYAITGTEDVAAVAFARLRRGASGFKGMAAAPDMLPGVKAVANWQQLQNDWRTTLGALAAEFERGHAAVAPRDGEQTCRTCDLHAFCRVHELPAGNRNYTEDTEGTEDTEE